MHAIISKQQFLIEHNRLSPINLQATFVLLTQFQEEKQPFLLDADWSFKLRAPFIAWFLTLLLLHPVKKKYIRKSKKQIYKNYPETHYL